MKVSQLAKKRRYVEERWNRETAAFQDILETIDSPETLRFFIDASGIPVRPNDCQMHWDGLFLTLRDVRNEQILFIYAPNGKQHPVFCLWNKDKKHTQYPIFRFWETWRPSRHERKQEYPNVSRDVLICIFRHLPLRELLECRQVCKQWHAVLRLSYVWDRYAGSFEETLKWACLVKDPGQFVLDNPLVMRTIEQAWLHRYGALNLVRGEVMIRRPEPGRKTLSVRPMGTRYPMKQALLTLECNRHSIAWVSSKKHLYIACFTNQKGCTRNPKFFREMMLDYF